jgi:hypothetical protein
MDGNAKNPGTKGQTRTKGQGQGQGYPLPPYAYTMFSANHFDFATKKIPHTEENLLYKMAQPLFRVSDAFFEFYAF